MLKSAAMQNDNKQTKQKRRDRKHVQVSFNQISWQICA